MGLRNCQHDDVDPDQDTENIDYPRGELRYDI